MTSELAPIPRLPYAVIAGVGAVLSVVVGLWCASTMGGDSQVLMSVAFALCVGAAMTFFPLLGPPLVTPERWGLAVMGVSGARTIVALGLMLVLIEMQALPRKPVVYGIMAGTFVLMFVEAAGAVWLLSRRERLRDAAKRAMGAGANADAVSGQEARGSKA